MTQLMYILENTNIKLKKKHKKNQLGWIRNCWLFSWCYLWVGNI